MNKEVWHRMMQNWIKDYNAISQLYKSGVITEEYVSNLRDKLLEDIIETFRSEVED